MIVKCNDNNGVGDCPYKWYCGARMSDGTITGCSMPLVVAGIMSLSQAVVERTVKEERKEE